MRFDIHYIGSNLQDMKVDEIDTGTMDGMEAKQQAARLIDAASELLSNIDEHEASSALNYISSNIE